MSKGSIRSGGFLRGRIDYEYDEKYIKFRNRYFIHKNKMPWNELDKAGRRRWKHKWFNCLAYLKGEPPRYPQHHLCMKNLYERLDKEDKRIISSLFPI